MFSFIMIITSLETKKDGMLERATTAQNLKEHSTWKTTSINNLQCKFVILVGIGNSLNFYPLLDRLGQICEQNA